MASSYQFPQLFKRLDSQKNQFVQHFIRLRESKQYRNNQRAVIVQGSKMIKELRQQEIPIKSLGVTAMKDPVKETNIKNPALDALRHPGIFNAQHNYLVEVDITRRILGTASRPGRHELFAEIPIPRCPLPPKEDVDRLLIFDDVKDPGNLGNLIRTGKALGWGSGVILNGTCDLYNDKTIRASRALSLQWNYATVPTFDLLDFLKSYDMTPLVADMMPSMNNNNNNNKTDLWSPLTGDYDHKTNPATVGSGPWLWNFKNKEVKVPKRPALILSSEHKGVRGLEDEIRISMPMTNNVESLNVASAGSLLMNELNRLIK
ncbi:Alpha/beta knot methyltransferase [Absidia repens]|uniref:Alpha/beta knot methyltransferase n=1 Tax=Absidia repens TaxID=90262 RepID=A0A1X2I4G3_9FUNG|nr:Alpha/beta knot methyltransferase [Absidia repens]